MTDTSAVNDQITDSVNQTLADLIGHAPAQSMGLLNTVMSEAMGMAMHNAVNVQHQAQMTGNASVTATCALILQSFVSPGAGSPGPGAVSGGGSQADSNTGGSNPTNTGTSGGADASANSLSGGDPPKIGSGKED